MKGSRVHEEEPICGGEAEVLIDPRPGKDKRVFADLSGSLERGCRGVLATSITRNKRGDIVLTRDWIPAGSRSSLDRKIVASFAGGRPRLAGAPRADASGTKETTLLFLANSSARNLEAQLTFAGARTFRSAWGESPALSGEDRAAFTVRAYSVQIWEVIQHD
jgi:hypothetical protein